MGIVHEVAQGEGGEQGDAMMPLLFSLGQHPALEAVHRQLRPGELLFAFLDDICIVCSPARVGMVHTLLENALWGHARVQVHAGKTKVWNRAGVRPEACDFLERRAQLVVEHGGEESTKQALRNEGSRFWGPRSGTQISSGTSCSTFGNTNRCCWPGYL